ncbi:hypothetical protein ACH4FX_31085 [Streptomyces sp. NPDC018019]|uniref:hypothetical protein n=1 Tax=Streptomyces sp. NPDC018019 TaxID=3365030 RepID=UPI0037A522FB
MPIAATYGSEAGFFSVTALMAGSFGSAALVAHTAVNQFVCIVFQVAVGLSHAAFIHVSRELALGRTDTALRRRRHDRRRRGLRHGARPGPAPLLRHRRAQGAEAVSIATHLPLVVMAPQFFDGAQNIGVGLLRGLDDTASGFRILATTAVLLLRRNSASLGVRTSAPQTVRAA